MCYEFLAKQEVLRFVKDKLQKELTYTLADHLWLVPVFNAQQAGCPLVKAWGKTDSPINGRTFYHRIQLFLSNVNRKT